MSRILIIGAGLSGATLAERFASSGDSVLVIDKRAHLAGNCFDQTNWHSRLQLWCSFISHQQSRSLGLSESLFQVAGLRASGFSQS